MIEITTKFLGVPLKIAGRRPKAGGLLFSKKNPKRYRKIEKKLGKTFFTVYSLKKLFFLTEKC